MTTIPAASASDNHTVIIYFYGSCPTCAHYTQDLAQAFHSVGITNVVTIDYSKNTTALNALSNLRIEFDIPQEFFRSATTIVDGKYVFEGYFPANLMVRFVVSNPNLERVVAVEGIRSDTYRLYKDKVTYECKTSQEISGCLSSHSVLGSSSIWALVLVAGFLDGLNPCAFSVLVYLVGVFALYRSRKEILGMGVVYVLSTYLVYLAIGLGLAQVIKLSGFLEIAAKTFGAIAIGLGILNIVGAVSGRLSKFSPRMSQRLFIPVASQFSSSWVQKSYIGAALLFGGAIAAIEFPCTGGIYLAVIGMLSTQKVSLTLLLYLLGYNLMFIMPLVILLVLLCGIVSIPSLKRVLEGKQASARLVMRFVSGLIMLVLGVSLFLVI